MTSAARRAPRPIPACSSCVLQEKPLATTIDVSITTALFTVLPDRLVPPPRLTIGAPNSAQARCVATMSSAVFGSTTPPVGPRPAK